jgi:WD40 repeat protein
VGWRSSDTGRSVLPPAAALQLEWVHGYAGVSNLGNNLWCASSGEAVYYTAAVGVVFDAAAHSQRFFLGHDDDISCLTIDGSRTHAASGQVGAQPLVLVWAVSSLEQLARLRHGRVLGVTAVGFSADGELLASVGRDDLNTVHVWDWRHERLLSTVEGQKAVPPAVWGVQWAPAGGAVASEQQLQVAGDGGASPACLVSYGAKHIKLWGSKDGRGKTASWSMKVLRFGESGAADVLGVAVLPSGVLVSGAPDGKLLVWRGGEVVARLRAHGHECRVVTLARGGRQLLSGGGDGRVLVWGVAALEGVGQPAAEAVAETDRKLAALRLRLAELDGRAHKAERAQVSMEVYALEKGRHGGSLELEPERVLAVGGGGRAAAVRGLDGEASGGGVLVGTSGCDVVRVSGEGVVAMVVDGHTADLHGVARSPVDGRLFATACDSAKVKVWDAQARCALLELRVGGAARAVCFSRDGAWLAVGLLDGSVEVLALPQVFEAAAGGGGSKLETRLHDSRRAVSALAWSPDGATLAVGNVEGSIDLYDVARWTRLARCRGHSTKVTQLDWSRDAALLQSNCNAYEILYWEGRSGRQVRSPQREYTQWDGWSCTLGWPVMGIWQEGFDPSDVNAAHASDDGSLVVVSDDRGGVCLFRFPCVAPRAACSRAAGHASHVSSVRWLLGSERCVSVGGHDRAVMQWRLVERPEPRASPPAQPPHSPAPTGLLAPRRDLPATATTMPRSIT